MHGVTVAEHLRTRRDQRGALVALEDGRYAVTGPAAWPSAGRSRSSATPGAGSRREDDAAARAWWQEVIGALRPLIRARLKQEAKVASV